MTDIQHTILIIEDGRLLTILVFVGIDRGSR